MKSAYVLLVGVLVLSLIPGVFAGDDASVEITIDYFNNSDVPGNHFPDMTNEIFVGEEQRSLGFGEVRLFLIKDGQALIDPSDDYENPNDDVPGLHILRGENEKGLFIQFNTHGSNDVGDIESLKFSVDFDDAVVTEIEQVREGYEGFGDGVCNIIEGRPETGGNDEVFLQKGENKGAFCTATGGGNDRIRVYYRLVQDKSSRNSHEVKVIYSEPLFEEKVESDTIYGDYVILGDDPQEDIGNTNYWFWVLLIATILLLILVIIVGASQR